MMETRRRVTDAARSATWKEDSSVSRTIRRNPATANAPAATPNTMRARSVMMETRRRATVAAQSAKSKRDLSAHGRTSAAPATVIPSPEALDPEFASLGTPYFTVLHSIMAFRALLQKQEGILAI